MTERPGGVADIGAARVTAIARTLHRIRLIAHELGTTPALLRHVQAHLRVLALRAELFPPAAFPPPPPERPGILLYRLSRDADRRFALYVAAIRAGFTTPPRCHPTWLAVVGLHGALYYHSYADADTHTPLADYRIQPGSSAGLPAEQWHSLHNGPAVALCLHLYGLAPEPDRDPD